MTQTDEILMRQVRDGDVEKLGILFKRHQRALLNFLSRTMSNRTVAADLAQEVFCGILKFRGTFRDDSCFKPWMFRIARNACLKYYERQPPESVPIDEDDSALPESPDPTPGEALERKQLTVLLKRAMLKLDPEKRDLLVLSRFREMTYDEIANVWGCGSVAVRVGAYRALKDLRGIFLRLLNEKPSCNVKKFQKT